MDDTITIKYPKDFGNSLRMNEDDFGKEMKTSPLVKLYELGKVSSGMAAEVLGISRINFLQLLSEYKVEFLAVEDLNQQKNL